MHYSRAASNFKNVNACHMHRLKVKFRLGNRLRGFKFEVKFAGAKVAKGRFVAMIFDVRIITWCHNQPLRFACQP
jgi:hypothetical protein